MSIINEVRTIHQRMDQNSCTYLFFTFWQSRTSMQWINYEHLYIQHCWTYSHVYTTHTHTRTCIYIHSPTTFNNDYWRGLLVIVSNVFVFMRENFYAFQYIGCFTKYLFLTPRGILTEIGIYKYISEIIIIITNNNNNQYESNQHHKQWLNCTMTTNGIKKTTRLYW